MRPYRSFLLLLIFLICFTGLSFFLPRHLNLPTPRSLFPDDLINSISGGDTVAQDQVFEPGTNTHAIADTLLNRDSLSVDPDSLVKDPLVHFLDSLRYSKGQVRIMYYGDSQIEGDRLTSYLRPVLRKTGGGTGPGLFLPVMPVTYTRSVFIRSSANWIRYNYLSYKNGEISHNNLGPCMAYCRYLPEGERTSAPVNAWIRVVPSKFSDSTTLKYDQLRIIYKNTRGNVRIDVRGRNLPLISDTLEISSGIEEYICALNNSQDVLIEFTGRTSPDIYGVSIESRTGVLIDNIPQRGSAGLEFTMVDRNNLREAYQLLSPDLVILHYGLNIVKNIRDDYSYYERGLKRQLALLNDVLPAGTPLLVIGVTDMAFESGDAIRPYPNLPDIIQAQRKASEAEGAFFWDAREAMGGSSSIVKWFKMDPPLAKKDFVHFTDRGADTFAGIMLSELFTLPVTSASLTQNEDITVDSATIGHPVQTGSQETYVERKSFFRVLLSTLFSYNPSKPFIFSAPSFWIFFLLVLAGYSLVYRKLFLRNLYLFLVSLYFYYKTGGLFLILLILVTLIDFTCGILINASEKRHKRKLFLLISIVSNIGILSYFKYTGFFIHTVNDIFGTGFIVRDFLGGFSNSLLGTSFNISNIILPVGISFFTFQSLSYTIDVYRRKLKPVKNIIDFGFYVSFFPQLVAGPIVRASEFIPQIHTEFHLARREFSHALFLVTKGLVKKIIISDFIAVNFVDRVFDLPTAYSGFENLMAIYGYGLQIYCDFSGYTDIAIGLALILGFRLPVNFNSPYKATGVDNFWKRWHISLSRWLKDYLYIPLGGNRKGRLRTYINIMITMLLGGLWHGADIRFVIWGGLHGTGLVLNKLWNRIFGDRTGRSRLARFISVFLTFQFVNFCWIFFRSSDLQSAGIMLNQIFGNFLPSSFDNLFSIYGAVFSLIAAGYLIHFLPEKVKESYRGVFIKIPLAAQLVIILAVAVMLFQMRSANVMPFIYFRF
jgi:D-alanyl-lipoteichoic acid acyltransferase DltB (MBOAT superfamily)